MVRNVFQICSFLVLFAFFGGDMGGRYIRDVFSLYFFKRLFEGPASIFWIFFPVWLIVNLPVWRVQRCPKIFEFRQCDIAPYYPRYFITKHICGHHCNLIMTKKIILFLKNSSVAVLCNRENLQFSLKSQKSFLRQASEHTYNPTLHAFCIVYFRV